MTYQEIIALSQAGFTKNDIYQMVTASPQTSPVAPTAPTAQASQSPQADMLAILQRLNAQQSGIDLPPARTSDDILSERLMSIFETKPVEPATK